jgi:hypothetical protein
MRGDLAVFKPISADEKLSPIDWIENTTTRKRPTPRAPFVSSTYVSIKKTCPEYCEFKSGACYVLAGFVAPMMRELDDTATHLEPDRITLAEATAINESFGGGCVPQDGAKGGRDLRLHVGGEVSSSKGAGFLASAAARWRNKRMGGAVWTFTKRAFEIERRLWGDRISVLGSCTTVEQAFELQCRGYVPALAMSAFPSLKKFALVGRDFRHPKREVSITVIPCPHEAGRKVTCATCRLCLDDSKLRERGFAIGFQVHGRNAGEVRRRLPVLRGAAP